MSLLSFILPLIPMNAIKNCRSAREPSVLLAGFPIIFVTASVMQEGREEIKDITNAGFIGKPINTRTFAKEISQFLKDGSPQRV